MEDFDSEDEDSSNEALRSEFGSDQAEDDDDGESNNSEDGESDSADVGPSASSLKKVHFDVDTSLPATSTPPKDKAAAYVPPHLRTTADAPINTVSKSDEITVDPRLNRVLSGHLNKLSTSNIQSILKEIETLYTANARAVVGTALVSLIVERVAGSKDILGEMNVLTLAALTAASYGKGIRVREGVVAECLKQLDSDSVEGKEKSNIVRFWARLYNLDVLGCQIIYDLIKELI